MVKIVGKSRFMAKICEKEVQLKKEDNNSGKRVYEWQAF